MNLLILTNNPNRSSYRQRIGNYLPMLENAGIETTVEVLSRSLPKRIAQYRLAALYDVILLHKKCLNAVDAFFFNPPKNKVIFNYDDAIMFNDQGQETRTHRKRFERSLQKAGKVLVGSSYLAQQAAAYHDDITVLPLGLKTEDYHPASPKKVDGKIRLVWIGSTATLEYIKTLTPVIQKLTMRYPNLILRLICDEFIDMKGVTIEKFRWTSQTRSDSLGDCDIGLAPLPDTPFTQGKCSFKVLEYSASAIPVVASPVGTNPDHIKAGQTGYLANTPDEWFEKLCELIDNKPLRVEMGQKGRSLAAQYDVSVVGEKLCNLIRQMVA